MFSSHPIFGPAAFSNIPLLVHLKNFNVYCREMFSNAQHFLLAKCVFNNNPFTYKNS